jgi:hypothetical protein
MEWRDFRWRETELAMPKKKRDSSDEDDDDDEYVVIAQTAHIVHFYPDRIQVFYG